MKNRKVNKGLRGLLFSLFIVGGIVALSCNGAIVNADAANAFSLPEILPIANNNRDINEEWPGQKMMTEQYGLSDLGWERLDLSVLNSTKSLSVFNIDVEGFEGLKGHIRFGGVNESDMKFLTNPNKQMRGLVFVVENTLKHVDDDEKKETIKYTYNYTYGNNISYTFRPISTSASLPNENDDGYTYENMLGTNAKYRPVAELYKQEIGQTGIYAIQARTDKNVSVKGTDFRAQLIKTLIPNKDGGVRIVNEVVNTKWEDGKESLSPRKSFGFLLGEDTKLNSIDDVPIYSLGTNKGVYIANQKDLFRVAFPRVPLDQGGADNYEGQWHNSLITGGQVNGSASFPAFRRNSAGVGTEVQNLPLDTRVWPTPLNGGKAKPALRPASTVENPLTEDQQGWDTQYVQKWIPRNPPELNQKAVLAYDVNVLPIYKPEIKINEESKNQSAHKDSKITFNGEWRDFDSLNVVLYYRIGTGKWIEFARDSRDDNEVEKSKFRPFTLELSASKFKLNNDSISFKAVDTTQVTSEIAKTDVKVFETVKVNAEHYVPDTANPGQYLLKKTVSQDVKPNEQYVTKALDYTADGLTLGNVIGDQTGLTPTEDVTIKYYYDKGVVTVITKYLKEDNTPLIDEDKSYWDYNTTYTTKSLEAEAKELDHYLKTTTGDLTGPTGTTNREIIVTYHYRIGVLGIVEVTNALDLGSNNLISIGSKDIYPTTDIKVTVLDELKGNWDLRLRISDELKAGDKKLEGDLYFQPKEKQLVKLNDEGQAIHNRQTVTAGKTELTWSSQAKEGLFYRQKTGNLKKQYQGKLEWDIVSAP